MNHTDFSKITPCGGCEKFPCEWIVRKIDWDKDGIEKLKRLRNEYLGKKEK